jgi:hypothetical protein
MAPLPPLLHLIATRPRLLADHAQAYAELLTEEIGKVSTVWKRRALLNATGLCAAAVAAVLVGVALMLWAVIPVAQIQAPWALIAAPLVPGIVALCCLNAARAPHDGEAFDKVRQQLQADALMLGELGAA